MLLAVPNSSIHLGCFPAMHVLVADPSKRAFFKDFARVVEASDVILEVLDARDPLATRCQDVERYVRKAGANKRVVLLLNKIGRPSCHIISTQPFWPS